VRRDRLWPTRLTIVWVAAVGLFGLLGWAGSLARRARPLTEWFFYEQDVAAALIAGGLLVGASFLPARRLAVGRSLEPPLSIGATLLAALVATGGWFVVLRAYPLSMDEFMARFDATIFAEGRLYATIPAEWRPIRLPLLAQFDLLLPDGASWSSTYLPVNAMVLAAFQRLGSSAMAGGVWMLVSGAAVWSVARRLWPERQDAAVVAVVLLATGAQALLTAMTPYAMSAHMALNMVWLALFMRDDRLSQAGAALVAFAACGLHQVVFHPLFAAPFIAGLWLRRRWSRALFHTLAYAAIGLFWISYWRLFLPSGDGVAAGGGASGLGIWISRVRIVADNFTVAGLGMMAKNLFRFLVWQNPAATALALVAIWPAIRRPGAPRALVGGMALTLAAVTAMMPYQGHGWGYRYLHGFVGALALLAALGWVRLTETAERRSALAQGVLAMSAASLLVLLPLRAWQANSFIRPYREAQAAVARAPAAVVAVDTTGLAFAADLVRNDPFLRNTPKVVDLAVMRPSQAAAVCSHGRVVVFDRGSGSALRPMAFSRRSLQRIAAARRAMTDIGCARERIVMR
jgi:hypothetical protein